MAYRGKIKQLIAPPADKRYAAYLGGEDGPDKIYTVPVLYFGIEEELDENEHWDGDRIVSYSGSATDLVLEPDSDCSNFLGWCATETPEGADLEFLKEEAEIRIARDKT